MTMMRGLSAVACLLLFSCSEGSTASVDELSGTPRSVPAAVIADGVIAPESFAMDPRGLLVFSDCEAQRVFRLTDDGQVEVIAGSGPGGFDAGQLAGDGGPATKARLSCPGGLAYDAHGNLYIADSINNRVRMVDPNGSITTVAGSGGVGLDQGGYGGDGGPATDAQLEFPVGLAFDDGGNLYVADHGNDAIRRIDSQGTISTFAGTGHGGYSGDGGPAREAQLHGPFYLDFDAAGDLFFTEKENGVVREVDTRRRIATVDRSSFVEPYGLAIDRNGNLFISDDLANVIKEIKADGSISIVAGTGSAGDAGDGGPATAAELDSPFDVALDAAGVLYVADGGNGCVREIDASGLITSLICA